MNDPALSLALALAAGMLAQVLARHLRIPGIVLLLGVGVLLGPDVTGLVRPETLSGALPTLVGFAVAVILFEGAMNLNVRRLRREASTIRRLVTLGAMVTMGGGAAAARFLMEWNWTVSLLFGTIVVVTGPTVVTPLLRRIRVSRHLETILEAEGVLVDAIGAIIAVLTLEVVLSPTAGSFAAGVWQLMSRLGFGILTGLLAGIVLSFVLRYRYLTPEGLENVLSLSLVLALYQASNSVLPESGLVAVTTAGLLVGNVRSPALRDLKEFKEQLTVLLIGVLFVLLSADVRVAEVIGLGVGGIATVVVLMVFVRPLNVAVCTKDSGLKVADKAFLAWIAPRGIVAAAISSLFAQELRKAGISGGDQLQALVFLVIAVTVVTNGITGGLLARLLGVRRPTSSGYVVMGASVLGLIIGTILREQGEEVVFIDSNPDRCSAGQEEGFRVFYGNALSESVMLRAELDTRVGCIALTANDEANLMFAQKSRQQYKTPKVWVALRSGQQAVTAAMVRQAGAELLFGVPRKADLWSMRLERSLASVEHWKKTGKGEEGSSGGSYWTDDTSFLPILVKEGRKFAPLGEKESQGKGDEVWVVILKEQRSAAESWLHRRGWEPATAKGTPGEQVTIK